MMPSPQLVIKPDVRETDVRYRYQRSTLGMIVVLVSFGMLFATLFLGYAIFRFQNAVWPPMGFDRVPLLIPILSTVSVLGSSVFLILATSSYVENKINNFRLYLNFTLALGLCFLALQCWLWYSMKESGLLVSSGIFSSILYGFTWIHSAHMLGGFLGLLFLLPLGRDEKNLNSISRLHNIGKFWHFLGIVWVFMFVFIFIL